jgi:putative transferase (TIGR04331 family)
MADTSRFLITTSDERSWDTEKPVLFLGEWCRLYNREEAWKQLDAEICPEYGRKKNQQSTDFLSIGSIYEELLVELTEALNQFHGVDHSIRYWGILIGQWLYYFITILFNRWFTIKQAINSFDIDHTYLFNYSADDLIPLDVMDFHYMYRTDEWNNVIYGIIISEMAGIKCEILKSINVEFNDKKIKTRSYKENIKKKIINFIEKSCSKLVKEDDAFIISPFLAFKHHVLLQLAMKQFPMVWHSHLSIRVNKSKINRNLLTLDCGNQHGVERFIRKQVISQMPTIYVEGYGELQDHISNINWPKKPKVIFTSNSFGSDEIFKAWAASKVEEGTPYVVGQHGTYYGMNKYDLSEHLEIETSDRFLTWGWEDGSKKYYPICALTCVGKKDEDYDKNGGLLLVELHAEHRNTPWDSSTHYKNYIKNQFIFVDELKPFISKSTTVRLYGGNTQLDWGVTELWQRKKPEIKIDFGSTQVNKIIRKNRLTVFSYNSTGILENLANNIPTIIFFDSDYHAYRDDAKDYINALVNVGIMHENPMSAAKKINEIWGDIHGWWMCAETQEAIKFFCKKYARKINNEIFEIKRALIQI